MHQTCSRLQRIVWHVCRHISLGTCKNWEHLEGNNQSLSHDGSSVWRRERRATRGLVKMSCLVYSFTVMRRNRINESVRSAVSGSLCVIMNYLQGDVTGYTGWKSLCCIWFSFHWCHTVLKLVSLYDMFCLVTSCDQESVGNKSPHSNLLSPWSVCFVDQ